MTEIVGDLVRPGVRFANQGRNERPGLIQLYAFTPKGSIRTIVITPDEAISYASDILAQAIKEKKLNESR